MLQQQNGAGCYSDSAFKEEKIIIKRKFNYGATADDQATTNNPGHQQSGHLISHDNIRFGIIFCTHSSMNSLWPRDIIINFVLWIRINIMEMSIEAKCSYQDTLRRTIYPLTVDISGALGWPLSRWPPWVRQHLPPYRPLDLHSVRHHTSHMPGSSGTAHTSAGPGNVSLEKQREETWNGGPYGSLYQYLHVDGLGQDCSISIANALEIPQSCTKPSMLCWGICCTY